MQKRGDLIGDYKLIEEISAGALTRTWSAEQISIQRDVVLEILKASAAADPEVKAGFVADVRAKATVAHPVIGAVYEAVDDEGITFYVREKLSGQTLEDLFDEGKRYTARHLVTILEQIGSAQRHLEKRRLATVSLAGNHIFIDDRSVRLVNLVSGGPRSESQAARDKSLLGEMCQEMLLPKHPGSTRVGSLLGYMSDLDREIPLTWRQVRDLSRQVADQFDSLERRKPKKSESAETPSKSSVPAWLWAALGGIAAIAGVFGVMLMIEDDQQELVAAPKIDYSPIPIGDEKTLAIHEVTIAEYAKFLESFTHLSMRDRSAFDHPAQPEDKKDHTPDQWHSLLDASKKGEVWKGRLVNEGCPIVGIDWWDAHAYCVWLGKGARLPTLKEWTGASGPTVSISGWGKASAPEKDRTELGFIGMAGNVREWTLDPEVNPSAPLQRIKHVASGGSFKEPSSGVRAVTWLESQSARADDLGFRVLFEKEEED